MKHIFLTLFLIFCISPAFAAEKDVVIKVNGMVCDFCAQSVLKIFSKEEGVTDIDVSLDESTVSLNLEDGATITDEKIAEIINFSGYDLVEIICIQ